MIGVQHKIEKIYLSQQAQSKDGFLLIYGDNTFSTFEIGDGKTPVQIDSFELNKNEYQVTDCVLFGTYIIASVDSKFTQEDIEFHKNELLKMTFAGKVSVTMPINYNSKTADQQQQQQNIRVTKLAVINQHLFLISSSLVLYYADIHNFNKYVQLAKLKQDYIFSDQTSVPMKFFDESQNKYVDGPAASVATTFGSTFNLNSIQVASVSGALSLDGANIMHLIFTFNCFNYILCKRINLSHCLVCQFGVQEI